MPPTAGYAQRRKQQFSFVCAAVESTDEQQRNWRLMIYSVVRERYREITALLDVKSLVVISSQNAAALLSSRGFCSSVSVFSGFQNFVSAFSYLRIVNMPVAR
jgi:hypothetical protein